MKLSDKPTDGLTFAFYKAKGDWRNWIVRKATNSIYSHCEVIFSLAEAQEEVLCHSASARDGGVRSKSIILRPDLWDLVHLPYCFFDEQHAKHLLILSAGAKYDYPAILLNHVVSLNRHSDERWFCSEFCAELIGLPNPHVYSPQALFDLLGYLRTQTSQNWPNDCPQRPTAEELANCGCA
ncbi:hypothetical protein [Cohaesibacter celericrescens]|uniref:Enoyl-CoA hydratase n=1 Tax=Cohaesibacter celericrescens TaxID=2067669 RepID=A0A2N5XML5_9HYPH|nr:hypothetical protein [Cohaesibacter celericrescens]PLW75786.1 hypothetical protein C0081_16880 [Cohaesibacter celericrescens]